ncbi:MAG: protein translocase subunit SecF [Proteobacteria bacterium]|nr:protein translocase subunit SecF [Pseudomonadota bacterium]
MRLLKLVPTDTRIDFIGLRRFAFLFSGLLVALSLVSYAILGLNFGIDFRGGILIEVRTSGPADLGAMRRTIGGLGLGEVSLQEFGAPNDVLVRVQRQEGGEAEQSRAVNTIKEALGPGVEYRRVEFVGPKVGAELREKGVIAVGLAMLAMLLYIWFRFEWQFGVAAVVALIHDVVSTIGLFSLLGLEFNLSTVAAVLTIAGYSINDTVVVFDRVRENLRKYKTMALPELFNLSANETLSRTTMTSFTTLLALIALYLFGGAVISDFSLAMIWGVTIGTYSSIFVAVALLVYLNVRAGTEAAEKTA